MTDKQKKTLLVFAVFGVVIFTLTSKKSPGKTIEVGSDFLLEAYRDLVMSDTMFQYEGKPLHLYLAANTFSYSAMKSAYRQQYGSDLTSDLKKRLSQEQFADFVNTVYDTTDQIVS
jgi:hypothetical protein